MDIRQLVGNDFENGQMQSTAKQANIWTALPGIIQTFNPLKMTCTVQPAIQAILFDASGLPVNTTLPLLVDCPIQFLAGGNCTITFPINLGDECLIIFASRCIDAWWQSSGVQPQAELRLHDLSDGFILLGFRSVPRVIANISVNSIQIRSDDGAAFMELNPTTHAVKMTDGHGATITLNGDGTITSAATTWTHTGNIAINGNTTHTGQVSANGHRIDETHKHTGVTTGGGQTGIVV